MLQVLGVHIRGGSNSGDNYCHPLDYFKLGCDLDLEVVKADMDHLPDLAPDYVVFGGGAIAKRAPLIKARYPSATLIGWGLGYTARNEFEPITQQIHAPSRAGYALYGCRDYIPGATLDYVPCVSCMHPFFDSPPDPVHDAVIFAHARHGALTQPHNALDLPYLSNANRLNLHQVLGHIASGRTVITSSYHGAYWATLLGRKVAMLPFGSKFMNLKDRPAIVTTVEEGLARAIACPGAVSDARSRNRQFRDKVRDLIWNNR